MLSDLDPLLTSRNIAALVVPLHEAMHPAFRWIARGAKVTRGYVVKPAGREPLLLAYPMERDEAAASGLSTRLVHDFGYDAIFKKAPNPAVAYGELFDRVLRELGVSPADGASHVAFAGNLPIHLYLGIADAMAARGWSVYRGTDDLVQLARKRKDAREIEAIRSTGERTEQVVDDVRALLRRTVVDGDHVRVDGEILTLGHLKRLVSRGIRERGMLEDHETILSQGRDAAVPHSRGDAEAPVRPSLPIVLDIFPADAATGYFFDLTRTFCVGPIPEELHRIHADVLAAFELAEREMRAGTPASSYQSLVCDYFEERGYPTTRSHPATLEGYVHTLGHGVGLDVHERPWFSLSPTNHDEIEVGDIVTIEPGLYFPGRALGVRIEDTLVISEDGRARTLARSSRGLEP
jgi:Xaa-Pro aminopeptidase